MRLMMPDLTGRRILLAGAESDLAPALAQALTESGARLALVSLSSDADAAYAVHRLARKVSADLSQAIDGTNDAAVRVMVRQITKALDGLDAVIAFEEGASLRGYAEKELAKHHGRFLVVIGSAEETLALLADSDSTR
jgi:enoyl-[acyl-carrier-protein] reductase (NADH)